ncbi:MAG: hypothetical protein QOI92_2750, partial [Chloroflexota bacterium]|nr:hypothetical protein [Chloroflexota bacterium]
MLNASRWSAIVVIVRVLRARIKASKIAAFDAIFRS